MSSDRLSSFNSLFVPERGGRVAGAREHDAAVARVMRELNARQTDDVALDDIRRWNAAADAAARKDRHTS
jgi:hypothetical protein